MLQNMLKAVVFDIDGTLTRDISWIRLTNEIGGSIEFNDAVFQDWRHDKISEDCAMKKLIENWSRRGKLNKETFSNILSKIPLREDAKETIKYLSDKGYVVTLITGSFDLYAQIVGDELGVQEYFAITSLIWDSNGNLKDIKTVKEELAKDKKIEYFNQWCLKHNLKPNECVAVGDSFNDIELFKITGNGIAVRSEFEVKVLEDVAWKSVGNLAELKNIL